MEEKKEKIFAEGIRFEKPKEGSPEFIKGKVSIKVAEIIPFLQKHQSNAGWVNLDLKKSQKGTLYLELNTWKPTPKVEETEKPKEPCIDPETGIDTNLMPF